jgi:hypothetical protein
MTVVLLLVVVVVLLGAGALAFSAGAKVRRKRTARAGHDPADNRINNGFNDWARRNPGGFKVLYGLLILLVVLAFVWKLTTM